MTREEFNEKARRDATAFRKELAALGVETEVAAQDTDEDYFVHLVSEAVCYAYSSDPQVQALADLKALLLLGVDANILRRVDTAFTPEITGERAHDGYFSNVMIPRLKNLGDDCPPEDRAKLVRELNAAAPPRYTFRDLLRDTYRAHPGLNLHAGGPEEMARREFFGRRVAGVLDPSGSKRGGKKSRPGGGKRKSTRGGSSTAAKVALMPELVAVDESRFNDDGYIESRTANVPVADRGPLRTALGYLYKDDGPVNLPRDRLRLAEPHLEAAERIVIRWLYTRTNGHLRSSYGAAALRAARASRYRCEVCKFADVRVLNLDHANGRVTGTPFACLCANCHTVKSRESDWTGEKPDRERMENGANQSPQNGGRDGLPGSTMKGKIDNDQESGQP